MDLIITHIRAIESRFNLRRTFKASKVKKKPPRDEAYLQLEPFLEKYPSLKGIPESLSRNTPKQAKARKRGRPITRKKLGAAQKEDDGADWEPAATKKQRVC